MTSVLRDVKVSPYEIDLHTSHGPIYKPGDKITTEDVLLEQEHGHKEGITDTEENQNHLM